VHVIKQVIRQDIVFAVNVISKILIMVNNKCFRLADLLHCLHCMVITMSYQQINTDGCYFQ